MRASLLGGLNDPPPHSPDFDCSSVPAAQIRTAIPEMRGILQVYLAVFQNIAGNGKPNRL
jgi:hypothetical protein